MGRFTREESRFSVGNQVFFPSRSQIGEEAKLSLHVERDSRVGKPPVAPGATTY